MLLQSLLSMAPATGTGLALVCQKGNSLTPVTPACDVDVTRGDCADTLSFPDSCSAAGLLALCAQA